MAEFVLVARAAKRMCESYEKCSECPMNVTASGCSMTDIGGNEAEEIEKIVMEWMRGRENENA